MTTTFQYLARKANDIFESNMRHAAQKICERQSLFHGRAA
jgi:hypothetical protein